MSDEKSKYWVGVLYPENMIPQWQDKVAETVQLPCVYCVHDKCVDTAGNPRKVHVHMMIVFRNTTTYKHALSVFNMLSAEGKTAVNTIKRVLGVRNMYNYLIHDTEDCRKKRKHLYDKAERVECNGFDIGVYEQLSQDEKEDMLDEMCEAIMENGFTNFYECFAFVKSNYDKAYVRVFRQHSGFFERLARGRFHYVRDIMLERYERGD